MTRKGNTGETRSYALLRQSPAMILSVALILFLVAFFAGRLSMTSPPRQTQSPAGSLSLKSGTQRDPNAELEQGSFHSASLTETRQKESQHVSEASPPGVRVSTSPPSPEPPYAPAQPQPSPEPLNAPAQAQPSPEPLYAPAQPQPPQPSPESRAPLGLEGMILCFKKKEATLRFVDYNDGSRSIRYEPLRRKSKRVVAGGAAWDACEEASLQGIPTVWELARAAPESQTDAWVPNKKWLWNTIDNGNLYVNLGDGFVWRMGSPEANWAHYHVGSLCDPDSLSRIYSKEDAEVIRDWISERQQTHLKRLNVTAANVEDPVSVPYSLRNKFLKGLKVLFGRSKNCLCQSWTPRDCVESSDSFSGNSTRSARPGGMSEMRAAAPEIRIQAA
uniref:Uncharacterized protein n=1 Tax=Chromera velia CCMP2878 TaxID=1169474 RepID=A0A0G4HGP5_9ALVE|eukprot:Cvel_27320.t1-p1 / transcript=Cvel_27320.t1 / gene=Cvel_27320 / organism=Chromera_velia_CCMP2878 / gene_product=hypothetical protein / transcript_product=hypothetical protein / location=Cvel_scaffold3388:4855-6644(+) / protein_length=388 / sequence_SO=supercontig / SO=protein_coding / is_pseudo=false